jgi:hypothetical protein
MGRFEETLTDLERAAQRSPAVLVAYSGGKDAMCTMDMCVRTFKHVEAFFMYLVPGLEHVEVALDFARKRWGIETIRQYPHFTVPRLVKSGCYCYCPGRLDSMPDLRLGDIYAAAMADSGIRMIATGAKKADSMFRRKSWQQFEKDYLVYPLKDWGTRDVFSYLSIRGLPVPTGNKGHQASGVDLTTRDLLRIYDSFPADFDKIEEAFPYVRAVVKRREWYGISE